LGNRISMDASKEPEVEPVKQCDCIIPSPRENWNVCRLCKLPCDKRYILQGLKEK
jgi:hypothetical protein